MRKLYTILFALSAFVINSQTLTQSFNEPVVGDVDKAVRLDTSGFLTGMPMNLVGANISWDFSKLKTGSDPATTSYASPSNYTASVNYPSATVVQDDQASLVFIKSVTTPTTRTEVLGLINPLITANFTNTAISAIYPIAFGATSTDNIAGTAKVTTINATCSGKLSYTADGTGTLTLADGFVYKNVIRVKSIQTLTATNGFLPLGVLKQTSYDFYDTSEKFPILSIGYSELTLAFGQPSVSAQVSGNSKSFTGINTYDNPFQGLSIFPNPCRDQLTINTGAGEKLTTIKVFNSLGAEVKSILNTTETIQLNLVDLPKGIYLIQISDGTRNTSRPVVVN